MHKNILLFTVSVFAFHAASFAQTTPVTPAAPQKSPIQQQFDDATAAAAAGDLQRAYDIYEKLESTLAARTPSKSLNIVRLRKGQMEYRLGRKNEGEAAISSALAKLDEKDASLLLDRVDAYLTLALIDEQRFDYAGAIRKLRTALSLGAEDFDKVRIYAQLIPLNIFVNADEALADADAALAIIARNSDVNKEWLGVIRGLRGRTLSNLGRFKEARADLKVAINRLGGLSSARINLLDAAARSDASIAATRDNDPEQGRLLLAYTGSSQASEQGFRLGVGMEPPACGGLNGPKPEDIAVVEFSIKKDGKINHVRPVYYSGDRAVAVQFASAVSEWFWDAETLKDVDLFFRALTRLELRCTTTFQKGNAVDLLIPAVQTWLKSITPDASNVSNRDNDQSSLDSLNATMIKLAQQNGADTPAMIYPLIRLSYHHFIPFALSRNYADRAYALAKKASAPPQVLAFLAHSAAYYLDKRNPENKSSPFQLAINTALAEPDIAKDPLASAVLRLVFFDSLDAKQRTSLGADTLKPIAEDQRLQNNDPVKVGALTRLANVAANNGNVDEARSLFTRTGLSAQQCALVDAKPVQTGGSLSYKDYPTEAISLGLGGWTVVEFDIDANGQTKNRRPLIAWPPFIFGDPAVKGIASFKYQQSYRPEGGLGCGGQRQRITYFLPK